MPPKDAGRLSRLIHDLDNGKFAARQKATEELERLNELVEEELRAALVARPGLEVTRRLEAILKRIDQNRQPLDGPLLQYFRALEVLERIGTSEARVLLQRLSEGEARSSRTREAQGSLRRLDRLRAAAPRP